METATEGRGDFPVLGGGATGAVLAGRYTVGDLLGEGGMAHVYRAHDVRLDRDVAVKILDRPGPRDASPDWREDRLTASLAHPNIVRVYDSGATPDGRHFLVMELLRGRPVSELAPLPPERALAVVAQVADALACAHERGIVHCDLKPQNVLVDRNGHATLTDFGVASAAASPAGPVVYGSLPYVAPERLRGAPVSPAVDIYALGALLFFALTARPPYRGRTPAEVLAQIAAGPPPTPPGAPPAVTALVRRALAPDPGRRFPTIVAFRDALGLASAAAAAPTAAAAATRPAAPPQQRTVPLSSPPPAPATPPRRRRPLPPPPRRAPALAALAALLLVALLVLGGRALAGAHSTATADTDAAAATVAVPDLRGLTLGNAYHRLLQAGLTPGRVDVAPGPGRPANVVVYQDPPPGATVHPGATVNYVIRTAP
ncbi:MAG TPA: serine/threonine protein kinase [Thermomicrobiales bacterium]|nr:serine/threonine protein kinase [Thermomicrobiales bacterium]